LLYPAICIHFQSSPRKSGGQSHSLDGAHTRCWVILIGVKFLLYSTFKIILGLLLRRRSVLCGDET